MGKKRFYDAVRDLIRDVHDTPAEPVRTRRRLSIASLLAAPQACAACWEPLPTKGPMFTCNSCLGAYCPTCLTQYAKTALSDRNLLPLRCADQQCRAPVALSELNGLLSAEEVSRLSRFQCEILKKDDETALPSMETEAADKTGHEDSDDGILMSLMDTMGWKRCPDCGMGIERTQGCPHMVCVCGGEFCYSCGERWLGRGQGCPRQCGLPPGHDGLGMELPARFDELRDEVWERIRTMLAGVREQLERDREAEWDRLPMPRIGEEGRAQAGRPGREEVSRVVTRSVSRNLSRNDGRPAKMRVGSLVHPSWENRS
eukprot:GFKZ01004527.1.p1 GENE.GFKZ01004527.1~~GFKZ01004527.1.p1  ORF type:complete len:315 (-),score=33.03 GFKZ01004527.1:352-1296(-)